MILDFIKDKISRPTAGWLLLVLILLFTCFVRFRLLDLPLERDEGEYAYMGQLMLQGTPPYGEAYNMKFPGTYVMYALLMSVFGQDVSGVHLGFMVVNCITIFLVFLLGKKIVSETAALAGSAVYAVLSLSVSVLGFAAHATHFVALAAVGGTLLLLSAVEKGRASSYIAAGILLSLSFIMKQPGVFFAAMGVVYVIYKNISSVPSRSFRDLMRPLAFYMGGVLAPLICMGAWLYLSGVFDRFWFWTMTYASEYGSQIPVSDAFSLFRRSFSDVVDGFTPLWVLAALGLVAAIFHRRLKGKRAFIFLFAFFSFLSVCPGFYFREHYFVTLLPAVSLLTGILIDFVYDRAVSFLRPAGAKFAAYGILVAALIPGIMSQSDYLFTEGPAALSRAIYGPNPFPESVEIARFIKERSSADDKVAVFGSEPQIFFYSGRHSATGYIYTYSLMENNEYALSMQKEMQSEVERSRPKFIVEVHVATSWLVRPDSEKYIFGWIENYVRQNYVLVGVADIISPDLTVYKWYADAANYKVLSSAYLLIYERR